jgi:hypothetical protein
MKTSRFVKQSTIKGKAAHTCDCAKTATPLNIERKRTVEGDLEYRGRGRRCWWLTCSLQGPLPVVSRSCSRSTLCGRRTRHPGRGSRCSLFWVSSGRGCCLHCLPPTRRSVSRGDRKKKEKKTNVRTYFIWPGLNFCTRTMT